MSKVQWTIDNVRYEDVCVYVYIIAIIGNICTLIARLRKSLLSRPNTVLFRIYTLQWLQTKDFVLNLK